MHYLEDLHSAESHRCSYREEQFRFWSERSVLPQLHATPHPLPSVTISLPPLTSYLQRAIGRQVCGTALRPKMGLILDLDNSQTSHKSLNSSAVETPFNYKPHASFILSFANANSSTVEPMHTPPAHIGVDYGSRHEHHSSFFGMADTSHLRLRLWLFWSAVVFWSWPRFISLVRSRFHSSFWLKHFACSAQGVESSLACFPFSTRQGIQRLPCFLSWLVEAWWQLANSGLLARKRKTILRAT